MDWYTSGLQFARQWSAVPLESNIPAINRFRSFFNARTRGKGIWKWDHYFDVYETHFRRFRNQAAYLLEIGVLAGGSLEMWLDHFGPNARIYGVDIDPACKRHEAEQIKIFIGDQADRAFWAQFRRDVPQLDIVIDDGGHLVEQQVVSLEELLPHLRPGGVFVTEDVHGEGNGFAAYIRGLTEALNAFAAGQNPDLFSKPTPFQASIRSITSYPFMTVIEKRDARVDEFVAPKRGGNH